MGYPRNGAFARNEANLSLLCLLLLLYQKSEVPGFNQRDASPFVARRVVCPARQGRENPRH